MERLGVSPDETGMSRRTFLVGGSLAVAGWRSIGVADGAAIAARWPEASAYSAEVPAAWFDLALDLVRTTPGFSPPVASRAFGYAGVALYEAVVPGIAGRRSLAGRLNGLGRLACPSAGAFHWPSVANSALASILRSLFATTPSSNMDAIDALERRFVRAVCAKVPHRVLRRSRRRGRRVARDILAWSRTDGGDGAYARNFPPYTPPQGPGLWVPTPPEFLPALQPYWGSNRPFVLPSGAVCSPGAPLAYSEDRDSRFYEDAEECYRAVSGVTPEQEAMVRFWADVPEVTATPPGHWIAILTQVVRALDLSLGDAAEAYAKLGVAVADAFIVCWHTKYRYNVLRPVTYIQRLIDADWTPLLVTPPFPEYTSGHSVQSAAAAQVLTDLLGRVAFTDHTHDQRGLPPRSFASFMDAAHEAAVSRMYGGIHFRAAIDRGLDQGLCVGRRVSALC